MNLDWHRLKAVVIESDDWGLAAWVADEQAHRVLADTPVFRSPVGRIYGRSTLESAADIRALGELLLRYRGGDGFPPVWQANTVMAAPDYARLAPPLFEVEELPLLDLPATPSRWSRPGMWAEVETGVQAGWWWPELHGLHHVPVSAWLNALRRGAADARRAHEQQCLVCEAVQAGGEYDASETLARITWNLDGALARFAQRFGRAPSSFCPPDYRWDERLETLAAARGVTTFQGRSERPGRAPARLFRWIDALRWPERGAARFYLPPRVAFEPRGEAAPAGPAGLDAAFARVRAAWRRGQPAALSTHRANYAHLDATWSERGRRALAELLGRLAAEGATFLVDAEVRTLVERSWSVRPIGRRGVMVRFYGVPREEVRFAAPAGVIGAAVTEGAGGDRARVRLEAGEVVASLDPGEYLIEWSRA
ncbi:MAG: hypothetical protein ACHQ52_09060 [Candidatus Eisenbacteria bacterium]